MLKVDGNPLLVDDIVVLEELKIQLALNGITRFNKIKPSSGSIQFSCPNHNGGQERKPSCGLSTDERNKRFPAGRVHCFSCGYNVTLEEMISHCFGYNDEGYFGKKWLLRNFVSMSTETRKPLNLNLSRTKSTNIVQTYVSEEELDTYRYYHDYMYERKLTNDIIEKFDIGYDPCFNFTDDFGNILGTAECITFPVRDENGNTLFIGRRSITSKMFHYPKDVEKPLYGLYEYLQYCPDCKEIVITESMLNALTCWVRGKPAFALNGTGTPAQIAKLCSLPVRKYILGLDPDEAGNVGKIKLRKGLRKNKIVTEFVYPDERDINDLSDEEFDTLQQIF